MSDPKNELNIRGGKIHLLFLIGPTATGKSDCAVDIAELLGSKFVDHPSPEILNADSVQFFSGVNIGAAKPSIELLGKVRHHLIGNVPIGSTYTAGQFRDDALEVIKQASSRGLQTMLAVGGSGFYVQALEKGMFNVPEIAAETREKLAQESTQPEGWKLLYQELKSRDSVASEKIKPNDRYRILRALEILRSHKGTLTEIRESFEADARLNGNAYGVDGPPFRHTKFGLYLNRDLLRDRIRLRTLKMLEEGLIDEVQMLRRELSRICPQAKPTDWSPMRSVGYSEVQDYLDGYLPKESLASAIETSTMQLAKRQMTWFKRDASIKWFDVAKGFLELKQAALTHIDQA